MISGPTTVGLLFTERFFWRLIGGGVQPHLREVFELAVEEAEELMAVRAGRQPSTNHQPLDLMLEAPMYDVEYGADTGAPPGFI